MPRSSTLLLAAALIAAGCSGGSESVFVDLSAVVDSPKSEPLAPVREPISVGSDSAELAPLEAQEMFVGAAEERAERALDEIRRNQERAFQDLIARLRRSYEADIARLGSARAAEIEAERDRRMAEAFEDLRAVFERHADRVGPKWVTLARLVGFPDPDPKSVRQGTGGTDIRSRRIAAAKTTRAEIAELDAIYRREVEQKIEAVRAWARDQSASWSAEAEAARAKREADAIEAARAAMTSDIAGIEASALDPHKRLAAEPGVSAQLPSATLTTEPWPAARKAAPEDLDDQARLFAQVHGYKLATRRGSGRDATEEFLRWRQMFRIGR